MSDLLSYLYTVLTRIWDWISYPLDLIESTIDFLNSSWSYVSAVVSLFPAWLAGSVMLVFALAVILFVLER